MDLNKKISTKIGTEKGTGSRVNGLNKAINFIICSLIFLMPVFFLPFTFEFYSFNKLFLLFFGVTSLLVLMLWKFIKKGEVRIVRTPIDWFVLGFVFFAFLSAAFSPSKSSSFLGFYGRFSGGFAEIFMLALFWWIVVQNWSGEVKVMGKSIFLMLLSNFSIALFSIFSLFDLGKFLPVSTTLNFIRTSILSPTGLTLQGLAVYFAGSVVLLAGVIILGEARKSSAFKNIFYWTLIILNFGIMALVDFWVSWIVLAVGLGILLSIAIWKRALQEKSNVLTMPLLFIVLSLILLGVNIHNFIGFSVAQEVLLPPAESISIISKGFVENPVLGSGPGSFWYNFNLNKGEDFLASNLWQLRFSRSHFGLLESLSDFGILGFIALMTVFGVVFLTSWALLSVGNFSFKGLAGADDSAKKYFLIFCTGLLGWFLINLLYLNFTVLSFQLWLFLALVVLSWQSIKPGILKIYKFDFKKFQELSVISLSLFIVFVLAVVTFWWQASKIYRGDMEYKESFNNTIQIDEKVVRLESAVKLVGHRGSYFRSLSRAYISMAGIEIAKSEEQRDQERVKTYVALSIQAAKRATEINPDSVSAWENLGGVYRDLGGLVQNAGIWSESSFTRAIELEPANPFLYVSLGRSQMTLAAQEPDDMIKENKITEALANLRYARDLKEGYLGAYLNEALALENQGKVDEAVDSLEDYFRDFIALGQGFWQDQTEVAEFFFQLGRFYYNQDEFTKAATNFIQTVNLAPRHSNARYSLGLSLDKLGRFDDAIEQLEIVLQLNPDNEAVEDKIGELKAKTRRRSAPEPEPESEDEDEE